ncbi:efflux RND transporter periplasmic adaptor subunit [Litchfieldella xinjiangensis]|uniref:efflux RND transporter periplasmic adaptor subunit n=1 Tax=Litchfieldella xinjiangensis TaxID=1166948 RepID=UPI00069328C6|nr:efflux RND transporter periplasmic adaptor subunit [Halomonas xinjiangensis]
MLTTIGKGRGNLLAMAVLGLVLAGCGDGGEEGGAAQQQQGQQQSPPRPAQVMEMQRQDLDLDKAYSAMLRSENEVTLVARVTGTLEERLFEPGDQVEKGESLYTIEPDVYQATVSQREADLESAQAQANRAQRDAERFERLVSQNSVSRQEYDQAQAELRVARASVAQARAALESAQIDLDYTDVTAPVAGMIGLSNVNVGNLVNAGTTLATITPLDPLEVRFQLPQRDAFALRNQRSQEGTAPIKAHLELPGREGSEASRLEGKLDFLSSRVDENTSTVQASAVFENPQGVFLPGQFVRVRLEGLKRYDVLAVPEIAVTQGLMGPQVFVLDEDDTARSRTVQLGEIAGPWQLIVDGLEPGDRVVVGDPAGIEPGTPIEAQPFEGDAEQIVENVEEAREEAQEEQMQQAEAAQGGPPAGGDAEEGDAAGDAPAEGAEAQSGDDAEGDRAE